ncbi:MAG: hypothetical protein GQ574_11845 [Crocinitomix sp.]|nr:hypothetical protein [Crocinitomix sp.]
MNWEKIYEFLLDTNLLKAVIQSIEDKQKFETKPRIFETSPVTKEQLERSGGRYVTKDLINLRFEDKSKILSRLFFLDTLHGLQLHGGLFRDDRKKITFFNSDFEHNMMQASEVSSAEDHFKDAVHEVSNAINNGGANLNGSWYFTEAEFNDFLKEYVHGFEAVYKSVQEINDYINGPYNI